MILLQIVARTKIQPSVIRKGKKCIDSRIFQELKLK